MPMLAAPHRSPSSPLLLLPLALALLAGCLTPRALSESDGHKKLGAAYLGEGDTAAAVKEYRLSTEKNRWDAESWHGLGMSYFAAGKHADAEKAILKALKLQPQFAQAHMNLGGLYLATERWDEAIPQLQAAVDDPEYREPARARHNLGWAYYNKGSFDEARTQYREVLRGFPRFCPAILNFGMVDEAEGKLQDALVRYKQAADCDPQDLKAPLLAGLVEARLDLVADACEHLGLVAKADPYGELRDQATESLRMLDCAAVTRR